MKLFKKMAAAGLIFAAVSPVCGQEKNQPKAPSIKQLLGLNDSQSKKLEDLGRTHGQDLKPLIEKRQELFKSLQDQVKTGASDADISATLDSLRQNQKDLMASNEKFQDQLAAFLTPLQRAKLQLGLAENRSASRPRPAAAAAKKP